MTMMSQAQKYLWMGLRNFQGLVYVLCFQKKMITAVAAGKRRTQTELEPGRL
jgi:hypothetical protein